MTYRSKIKSQENQLSDVLDGPLCTSAVTFCIWKLPFPSTFRKHHFLGLGHPVLIILSCSQGEVWTIYTPLFWEPFLFPSFIKVEVKWSRYRPAVTQTVVRGIALLFLTAALEGGESSAARPGRTLPPEKETVPILQDAGWAPGPVWTGGKSRPHRDSILDRLARSQSLYRLSYPAHSFDYYHT